MRVQEIKDIVKKHGGGAEGKYKFVKHYQEPLLNSQPLPNGAVLKGHKPEDWSLRALWEGLVGPIDETLPIERYFESTFHEAALDSTMFPKATGNLILNKVIDAYNSPGYISDELVENMPSNLKSETIVGFTATQGPLTVLEGEPYKESSMGEKYVTTATEKKGRIISLTEEDVIFDKTGQLMMRARGIGEMTRQAKEIAVLKGVVGTDANVFRPSGAATTLYASGNTNLKTSNAFADWSSIDAALQYHAATMKDDRQGETAQPVLWLPNTILCGPELITTVRRVVGATEVRAVSNTNNTTISANPFGNYRTLSTTLWSALGLTAGDWFIGDFKRQFIWHEIYPIQTFAQGATSESAFEKDVVARFKVRYYGGIAAIDTKYVVKNTVS